jgi:hypothetical protein
MENAKQKEAREMVEVSLRKSFGLKLAQGVILRLLGVSLGTLWRKREGSDNVQGTCTLVETCKHVLESGWYPSDVGV